MAANDSDLFTPEFIRQLRTEAYHDAKIEGWPDDVRPVTIAGATLIGVDRKTFEIYWDGKKIVTRSKVRLGTFER